MADLRVNSVQTCFSALLSLTVKLPLFSLRVVQYL